CVLGTLLILAAPVYGQSGSIVGTVVDATGGVVPGAVVTLSNRTSRQSVTTGATGEYRFPAVSTGTYSISIMMPGFAAATHPDVVVASAQVTVPAITLAVAGVGEAVVVSASKVEAQMSDAPATMTVLSGESLATLPAQNYGDILRSVPGVNVVQLSARDV